MATNLLRDIAVPEHPVRPVPPPDGERARAREEPIDHRCPQSVTRELNLTLKRSRVRKSEELKPIRGDRYRPGRSQAGLRPAPTIRPKEQRPRLRFGEIVRNHPISGQKIRERCVCPTKTLSTTAREQSRTHYLEHRRDSDLDRARGRRLSTPRELPNGHVLTIGINLWARPDCGNASKRGHRSNATGDRHTLISLKCTIEARVAPDGVLLFAQMADPSGVQASTPLGQPARLAETASKETQSQRARSQRPRAS